MTRTTRGSESKHSCNSERYSTGLEQRYKLSSCCTEREFLAAVKLYAREIISKHNLDVAVCDLDWEVSYRAKRRAGALHHSNGAPQKIQITWEYFENKGWVATTSTIRHELIHAHLLNTEGDASHGSEFEQLADQLDTEVYCGPFTDPSWWVICEDCGQRIPRYKKSKLIRSPKNYKCGKCGGDFEIIDNNPDLENS